MLGSCVVYCGFAVALVGIAAHEFGLAAAGVALAVAGLALPAPARRVVPAVCRLDDALPVFEFYERHSLRVSAPAADVLAAARGVSADEIRLLRGLMWLRSLGRSRLLGPRGPLPVIDAMQRSGFVALESDEREVAFGAVGRFWSMGVVRVADAAAFAAFDVPGYAQAATNFRIVDESAEGCLLVTETRIHGTSAGGRRRFAAYWRLIYPGSALIRRMWLRAIARRVGARPRS